MLWAIKCFLINSSTIKKESQGFVIQTDFAEDGKEMQLFASLNASSNHAALYLYLFKVVTLSNCKRFSIK